MRQSRTIFVSALMLTGVNLLLRAVGTAFHVYLSRRIGAAGLGLLQLVMSVSSLAMVAGIAGIRTATMYLSAEELGKAHPENIGHVLSSCFLYSILCSCTVSSILFFGAPLLADKWIGNPQTVPALRIAAAFLPVVCLSGVMSGYFTAANRIDTLAAIEVAEQIVSMGITIGALTFWAKGDPGRACASIVFGSSTGSCVALGALIFLYIREHLPRAAVFPLRKRLLHSAVPLAAADVVRSGISTTENLLVPKRLSLCPDEQNPMSSFGQITGMVFPVMMFPACILFALAELLIPELARCKAAGKEDRIHYLLKRGLWVAMIYGIFFGGLIFLYSDMLCSKLYRNAEAGRRLRFYAIMIPFLYCDAITDAMTKGLGEQKQCVKYNIITSAMDVVLLFFFLPVWGTKGYFISFFSTHILNFILSIRWLCRITGIQLPLWTPICAITSGILAVWISIRFAAPLLFIPAVFVFLFLFGIIRHSDLIWFQSLITRRHPQAAVSL